MGLMDGNFCASADNGGVKKMKVQFATGPLLKFQIWHIASFLSMFKLLLIGVIIVGKDPFALFGMQAPDICLYDGVLLQQYDRKSVYVYSSVVKLSYGCEVTFMKVCAESRDSTSARRMFCVLLTVPLGDAPPTDACVGSTATTVAI
ncbi:hypothetical protein cypCar_00021721 [Cyprinus carpio]|nr:hypothetical protein cypCar_00021721 [Cyprinus carpio]